MVDLNNPQKNKYNIFDFNRLLYKILPRTSHTIITVINSLFVVKFDLTDRIIQCFAEILYLSRKVKAETQKLFNDKPVVYLIEELNIK